MGSARLGLFLALSALLLVALLRLPVPPAPVAPDRSPPPPRQSETTIKGIPALADTISLPPASLEAEGFIELTRSQPVEWIADQANPILWTLFNQSDSRAPGHTLTLDASAPGDWTIGEPASRAADGTIRWPVPSLAPGESAELELSFTPAASLESFSAQARSASYSFQNPRPVRTANVEVHFIGPTSAALGDPLTVSWEVFNAGEATLTQVSLWVPLPPGTYESRGNAFVRERIRQLRPGERTTREVVLIPSLPGALNLSAQIRTAQGIQTRVRSSITLETAVLEIRPASPPAAATDHERCFVIYNHGSAPARNLVFRQTQPLGPVQFLGDLAPGAQIERCLPSSATPPSAPIQVEVSASAADIARFVLPSAETP